MDYTYNSTVSVDEDEDERVGLLWMEYQLQLM